MGSRLIAIGASAACGQPEGARLNMQDHFHLPNLGPFLFPVALFLGIKLSLAPFWAGSVLLALVGLDDRTPLVRERVQLC